VRKPSHADYRVRAGDTLSSIAVRFYGTPSAAEAIARENRIRHRDLILVGLKLRLPDLSQRPDPYDHHNQAQHKSPAAPQAVKNSVATAPSHVQPFLLTQQAAQVAFPAIDFPLVRLKVAAIHTPEYDATITLKGDLTLSIVDKPVFKLELDDFFKKVASVSVGQEYEDRAVKAGGEVNIKPDFANKTLEFSCGFTTSAKVNGKTFMSSGVSIGPNSLKYTLQPQPIEGEINGLHYKGELGYEIEVTFKPPRQDPQPSPSFALSPSAARAAFTVAAGGLLIIAAIAAAPIEVPAAAIAGLGVVVVSWSTASRAASDARGLALPQNGT
jgi:hypothetical protein